MEELDLSDFFHTKAEANDFSIHLSQISESIYQTGFNLEKEITEHFGVEKKDKFISFLRNNKVNIYSTSDLKTFFDKIQAITSNLPLLSLVIAFEPNEETLKLLSEWLFSNTHKQVLLDITVDTKIIGGATISFNGKYADCSIKTKFDQIFQDVWANKPAASEKVVPPQGNHQSLENIVVNR